jgi:UDP-N-acetylmuramate: L-alanyl-gamma-D-glutamyl-meso-diaminopimelate ligase
MSEILNKLDSISSCHLIGICGTGMGSLAGLLVKKGYRVTGSDSHAYPPMSQELQALGIEIMQGYSPSNLEHKPDLVVVGNICKKDHIEAAAARDMGLLCASMPQVLHDLFLVGKTPIVITGTHGKTTTTALTAFLLEKGGMLPGLLVGGVTKDFGGGYKLGQGEHFVLEGDEYDSAWFHKEPKFLSYAPSLAVITSVEHDHIDIYPSREKYVEAFKAFAQLVYPGPLVAYSGCSGVREVLESAEIECPFITYGVEGDPYVYEPAWLAKPKGNRSFSLTIEGRQVGTFSSSLIGKHNLRNTLAAMILAHKAGLSLEQIGEFLPDFGGVARRQQVVGIEAGVTVYDDFAHHPTAIRETLEALKQEHKNSRIIAAFEPRSATACRNFHQKAYASSFEKADFVIIAPLGREIPEEQALKTSLLAQDLSDQGIKATAAHSVEHLLNLVVSNIDKNDVVVFFSNGSFKGVHKKLISTLAG